MITALENLTTVTLKPCFPWDFIPAQPIAENVKIDKLARQDWYQNPDTRHNFYTGIEALNSVQRISKNNPPRMIHWLAYDVDAPLTVHQILEKIATLRFTPQWWERSLGGNLRLLFKLEKPIKVDSMDYAAFILEKFQALTKVAKKFPAVDTAYKDPARLYCNGCEWHKVSDCVIGEDTIGMVLMAVSKEYNFKGGIGVAIPLAEVEQELRKKFPAFDWPGSFEAETQGPSFWIPGSTSPLSAIVKPEGMFTFSAHAEKPFYNWSDLLGHEFTDTYRARVISTAVRDVWYDGQFYYYRVTGDGGKPTEVCFHSEKDFRLNMKRVRSISDKKDKDGTSMQDTVISYVHENNRVSDVKPFMFNPNMYVVQDGKRCLNIYEHRPIMPAEGVATWGPTGEFPFISQVFEQLLEPASQLSWLLAWYKVTYLSCIKCQPTPGQIIFIAGRGGTGKSLVCRHIFGPPLGGFADGAAFLTGNDPFGGEMFNFGLWCIDDELIASSDIPKTIFQGNMKKVASNSEFRFNQKFIKASKVTWLGRITVTLNLDLVACRALIQPDENTAPKYAFLRGSQAEESSIKWPSQVEIREMIARELPFFLRWLVDWDIPAEIPTDPRYTIGSFHHPELMERAMLSGRESQFREVLDIALGEYFNAHHDQEIWVGTATHLQLLIYSNPSMQEVLRSLRVEQVSRYLELLHREKFMNMQCSVHSGTRRWTFHCPEELKARRTRIKPLPPTTESF